jgi:uncharacterized protein YlzI (FlbEa/FlbD family)
MSFGIFMVKKKHTPLNSTAIDNIFSIFPDINLEWLITGKGQMFKSEPVQLTTEKENEYLRKIVALQEEISELKDEIIEMQRQQNVQKNKTVHARTA